MFLIHYDSHFRLVQYDHRIKGLDAVHPSIAEELTPFERKMVESQDLIEIRGKVSTYMGCLTD